MTRRRPRAWPTVTGALALFAVVFQLLVFQATAPVGSTLASATGGKTKPAAHAVAPSPQPAPVVTSTS